MEKFLVTLKPSPQIPTKPNRRRRWHRSLIELTGKLEPNYRHSVSGLLMQSYSELRALQHLYHIDRNPCQTHMNRVVNGTYLPASTKEGISALDFDNKVVCTSMKRNEVLIFDISYISSTPSEVLRTKPRPAMHGSNVQKGLSDIAFTSCENSRFGDSLDIVCYYNQIRLTSQFWTTSPLF